MNPWTNSRPEVIPCTMPGPMEMESTTARRLRSSSATMRRQGKNASTSRSNRVAKPKPLLTRSALNSKYVDSHLRPYRCKFADRPECEDARFSSNACLFRHEREAHGLHNHGVNPFLCKFPDCDRAREGNGFPRRWNQRDHMKRVHDYIEPTSPKAARAAAAVDSNKRRKTPSSTPMRRSNSSAASKAQAMANAALPVRTNGRSVSQACYGAPCTSAIPVVDRDAMTRQPSLDKVQITATATFSRTSRDHRC